MNTYTKHLWIIILSLGIISCQSPSKLLQKHKYDRAINRVIRQLKKGKAIDPEYRIVLEKAFDRRIQKDMKKINSLKRRSHIDDWEEIIKIAERITALQDKIEPYLPLYDLSGIEAQFKFVKTDVIINHAIDTLIDQYNDRIAQLVHLARSGDKSAAREALSYLDRKEVYTGDQIVGRTLRSELFELGMTKLFFRVENRAMVYLPRMITDELAKLNLGQEQDPWTEIDYEFKPWRIYDYEIRYQIQQFNISPEFVKEIVTNEQKDISTTDYKRDVNGQIVLDSLCRKIEITKIETVTAQVTKVIQNKKTSIRGVLEIIDLDYGHIVFQEPVEAIAVFDKESCTYKGDKRALPADVRITDPPVDFPSDDVLFLEVVDKLKPALIKRFSEFDFDRT